MSAERENLVSSPVLATMIFVLTELMFFSGLISAFVIVKSGAAPGMWPPPGQPRLPIEATAVNTVALLISGGVLVYAWRRFQTNPAKAQLPMLLAFVLGAFFVLFQGWEWARLIGEGLTLQSSRHGSFFFLIVGAHALHVIGGLAVLGWVYTLLLRRRLTPEGFAAMQVFWLFVVLLWPVLYWLVYL